MIKRVIRKVKDVWRKQRAKKAQKARLLLPYAERYPDRRDVQFIEIASNVRLDVYWKVLKIGRGPALTLNVGTSEAVKFDIFGPGEGHYHEYIAAKYPTKERRIFFFEQDRETQIERAIFELTHNLRYYLQAHRDKAVRDTHIEPDAIRAGCDRAREIMHGFLRDIPELKIPPKIAAE
ncbi:MAG: hypothetical protein AAFN59_14185 [Pseudomonadota bacterium]